MADLSKITVGDCELSVRTIATVGRNVTLATLDELTDVNLAANGLTRRSIKELREVIANAKMWADPSESLASVDFLRDLVERIFQIPVMYRVDQGDCDRLEQIARKIEELWQ